MGKKKKRCYCGIGGQAVLEGVMMKNMDRYAVAVRKADGTIEIKSEDYPGIWGGKKITKLPFIRGVFNFVDSLVLGMNTLTWSAEFFEEEEPKKEDNKKSSGASDKLVMGATVAFSIVMAVAIFIMLPYFLSTLFSSYVRNASLLAILEGVLRIVIFVGYVAAISAMKDIRRVYMYHGAEHKCINCIERGRELTVKNVRKSSRQHRRCGTSFLLFVMLVSVILFMFIRVSNPALRLVLRLALVPVIAGISYEIIRLAGKSDNFLVRIISAPGMWLQKLTTREPDDSMIEVAIASVEAVFDWKAYLKETFDYDIDAWEKKEKEEEAKELEDREAAQRDADQIETAEKEAMEKLAARRDEVRSAASGKSADTQEAVLENDLTEEAAQKATDNVTEAVSEALQDAGQVSENQEEVPAAETKQESREAL